MEMVLLGFLEFKIVSIILLKVVVLTVGWSPVTQSAISDEIFERPFNKETERPTSTGSFLTIFNLSS